MKSKRRSHNSQNNLARNCQRIGPTYFRVVTSCFTRENTAIDKAVKVCEKLQTLPSWLHLLGCEDTVRFVTNIRPGSMLVKFIAVGSADFCSEIKVTFALRHFNAKPN